MRGPMAATFLANNRDSCTDTKLTPFTTNYDMPCFHNIVTGRRGVAVRKIGGFAEGRFSSPGGAHDAPLAGRMDQKVDRYWSTSHW